MKLIYITSFLDGLMIFVGSFLLFTCFFKSISLPISLSSLFAVILAVIFFILFLRINLTTSQQKQYKSTLSKKKKAFNEMLIALDSEKTWQFFCNYVFNKSKNAEKIDDKYTYNGYNLLFLFLPDPLSPNIIAYSIKNKNLNGKIAIFSTIFSKEALLYCKQNAILTFSADQLYDFIKNTSYSESPIPTEKRRLNINNFKLKANYKRSLIFGISLLILSEFSFFPIYYRIFGSLFTIYAIIIAFYGKITPTDNILLNDFITTKQ